MYTFYFCLASLLIYPILLSVLFLLRVFSTDNDEVNRPDLYTRQMSISRTEKEKKSARKQAEQKGRTVCLTIYYSTLYAEWQAFQTHLSSSFFFLPFLFTHRVIISRR
jgi:hypothetical protein